MTTGVYCTYFDYAYAPRGRVLIESLRRSGDSNPIYVLALDDESYAEVSSWLELNIHALHLSHLEDKYPQLSSAKADRSRMEYVFTLTPWLTKWSMDMAEDGAWVTYLDADMAFFSSTQPLYQQLANSSVGIVEHRFTWEQAWRRRYGIYNVAWVSFRKDEVGRACLNWWADQCLLWCKDEVDSGRFADQGYLDQFPKKFSGVRIINLPGADVAPWNLRRHTITFTPPTRILIDGEPLIFFHFHGLRQDGTRFYFKHIPYFAQTTRLIRDHIYRPYCEELASLTQISAPPTSHLRRQDTILSSLRFRRASLLRRLGSLRGDLVDISRQDLPG